MTTTNELKEIARQKQIDLDNVFIEIQITYVQACMAATIQATGISSMEMPKHFLWEQTISQLEAIGYSVVGKSKVIISII